MPDNVYKYDLNSAISVYLTGDDAYETKLQFQGRVELYAEDQCRYALRLQNVQITGPDNKKGAQVADLSLTKEVRFTLSNDELSSQICVENDDSEFGLNVKRAVISLLQSSDSKSVETDVFGTCPTTFSSSKSDDTVYVSKVRNLNACGYRESLVTGLIAGVFDENSGIKSTPLLSGDYTSEQTIKNGILEKVNSTEEYIFVPYSTGVASVRAKVLTKLTLKSQNAGKIDQFKSGGLARTILFENPSAQTIKKQFEALKSTFLATIEQFHNNIGSKAANQFTEIIHHMRYYTKTDLLTFFKNIDTGTIHPKKELARSVYLDALFRTGTTDSVQAIADLIKEFNDKEKRLAYLSFNLVSSIDKAALPVLHVCEIIILHT